MSEIYDNALTPIEKDKVADYEMRFSRAAWFEVIKSKVIICGGCGGIMSNFIFQLSRVQPKAIYMFDPDRVEYINLAGQLFGVGDVGKYKVDASAQMVKDYSSFNDIFAIPSSYDGNTEIIGDIMICGFDSINARKVFFNKWYRHLDDVKDKSKCLFIDGRLSFNTLQVYTIRGDDEFSINKYISEALFPSNRADQTVCSMKQTSFMANMIASYMVNNLVNFCANEVVPEYGQLPYFMEYDSDIMNLKVE